ncbi:MAG: DNA replication/repair protein RecF [Clostridia bacterium]|nr:DNA replication/repair protein RecF [Clostridia bacterium]
MQVHSVKIKNFRNITDMEFEVDPYKNVLFGSNAMGKTNILEAIWLFSGAKSFRNGKEKDLIKFGEQAAKISIDFTGYGTRKTADIVIDSKSKQFFINGKKRASAGRILGVFNVVAFSPDDLRIVKEEPEFRRRFLDSLISRCEPAYLNALLRFNKIHAQRNKLLRDYSFNNTLPIKDLISSINEVMFTEAATIAEYRKEYVKLLNKYGSRYYHRMSGKKETFNIDIATTVHRFYRELVEDSLDYDIKHCTTKYGPHKDELAIEVNGKYARNYASQGQQRSVAVALKLAEAEIIRVKTGDMPVLIMDDVLSELDPERQAFILNFTRRMQVFVSCCDISNFMHMRRGQVYRVKYGTIEKVDHVYTLGTNYNSKKE